MESNNHFQSSLCAFSSISTNINILQQRKRLFSISHKPREKVLHKGFGSGAILVQYASLQDTSEPEKQSGIEIPILGRGEKWIAIDKPSGVLTHRTKLYHSVPGERYLVDMVTELVKEEYGTSTKVFPVQRLDRPTSGVMIFGLDNSENAAQLQNVLQSEQSRKYYWALTFGTDMPGEWTNDNPLKDMTGKNAKRRAAVTHFEQLGRYDVSDMSVVRARIVTGRRHQIRRHLSNSRYPVVGDTTHGKGYLNRMARDQFGVRRCCLHARRLCFIDLTTSQEISLESPVPTDLLKVLRELPDWNHVDEKSLDLV